MDKYVKLSEETRVLFNKAQAKVLGDESTIAKVTDDIVVKKALEVFLYGNKPK